MFKIGIICGGPSLERGISLNSARTLIDHLNTERTETTIFFVDHALQFHQIDSAHLYSNTPSDFDFKMERIAQTLCADTLVPTLKACDIVFPIIHGQFGEDGTLQQLLENAGIPFVGTSSQSCKRAFLKNNAQRELQDAGFATIPFLAHTNADPPTDLEQFWQAHCTSSGAIIKPNNAGSSLDVWQADSFDDLCTKTATMLERHCGIHIQPFHHGREMTLVVVNDDQGQPVALLPTETILQSTHSKIFDYRSKYLPTNACRHHTPAPLTADAMTLCRETAEAIFSHFELRDFARLDGWFCPEQGFICYDINIISGFEENSFLFKQTATCGMTHGSTIHHILQSACRRYRLSLPPRQQDSVHAEQEIFIISGGKSSERQVSLMSGRNVWFKLSGQADIATTPFFLDKKHHVWQLPYAMFLHHTVEEIEHDIATLSDKNKIIAQHAPVIATQLKIPAPNTTPIQPLTLAQWVHCIKEKNARVLLALHGGIGEDGTIQQLLSENSIEFNGSDAWTSQLCMNKNKTVQKIQSIHHPDISSQAQSLLTLNELIEFTQMSPKDQETQWKKLSHGEPKCIIKPMQDGCSSGIVSLSTSAELLRYAQLIKAQQLTAPANTFQNQPTPIELPNHCLYFLIEPFIVTDIVNVENAQLKHRSVTGWFELTVVVCEHEGQYHSFNPSITVSSHAVLTVEEKFQGGTGINLTPPPEQLISSRQQAHIRHLVCLIAETLKIRQYARLDIFYNTSTEKLQLIEANTLPALTPSTVLFQQALAEIPPIAPRTFVRRLVNCAQYA